MIEFANNRQLAERLNRTTNPYTHGSRALAYRLGLLNMAGVFETNAEALTTDNRQAYEAGRQAWLDHVSYRLDDKLVLGDTPPGS